MTDLAAWLLEQIAEDERLVNARAPDTWVSDIDSWHTRGCGYGQSEFVDPCSCDVPARVLAECDAKRRVIHRYLHVREHIPRSAAVSALLDVLRDFTLAYVERSGYLEEWAPTV
jgi:hypothetical protein